MLLVGAVVMVAVFAFLFPQLGNYEQAFAQLAAIPPLWIVALVAAGVLNIVVYPFTATAANGWSGEGPSGNGDGVGGS